MPRASQAWLLAVVLVVSSAACSGVSTHDAGSGASGADSVQHARLMAQPVVYVPGNIDYTGKTDVTNALQTFIDNVDNGTLVRFRVNGRYRVEGTLFVTNKTGVTFDGQNSTIVATTSGTLERSQWWITGGGDLIFRRIIVHGANPFAGIGEKAYNPAREKQHGFRIEGVDGIQLDRVTVTDVYGDFVYIARYVNETTTNVWIHDSTFKRNGRQGVSLVAATGVIIERNTFTDTRHGTIDLEPNGPNQTVSHAFILNNNIGVGRLFFIASHGKGPVSDIVVSGNKLHKHVLSIDVVPLKNQRRKNWIVTNNTSDLKSSLRPIRFNEVDGVQVTGNTQPVVSTKPGVETTDSCGVDVKSNAFGSAQLVTHGAKCNAVLTVPSQPAIAGRP